MALNPPAGSSQFTAKDGTPLDPTAATLTRAIRQVESGGNFNTVGDKGTSKGAYQFNGSNFKDWAKTYNLNPDDFSPENQDKVAYSRVKHLLDQGFTQSQVASIWNSGNKDPNAVGKGINAKLGVKYDVPAYVEKVKGAYGQQSASPQFAGTGADVAQAAGKESEPDTRSFGRKALDFAFPIVSDIQGDIGGTNKKTPLQQVGDAALSALWFVPGLGQGSGLASRVAGKVIGQTGAKIAGRALEGAAVGYGSDVASNLSEGKKLGDSFSPGLGTLTGGLVGPALGSVGDRIAKNTTQVGALGGLTKNIEENLVATKPGLRLLDEHKAQGHNPADFIARSGAIPDVVDNQFVTRPQQKYLQGRVGQLGQVRAEALDVMGTHTQLDSLEAEALAKVKAPTKEMLAVMSPGEKKAIELRRAGGESGRIETKIRAAFDDLRANYGDSVPPSVLESIKEAHATNSGIYKRTGAIGDANASSIIGDVARSKIEKIAEESGLPGMKEYNKYIASHYKAIDALKLLNGQKVKGGRLGNMLRSHAIGTAASVAGGIGGGGFAGALLGFGGGELVGNMLGKILGQSALSNPLRDAILKRMSQENPEIVNQMLRYAEQDGKKVAPLLSPKKETRSGLIPRTLTTAATRAAAPYSQ